jgi:hypothetical protein
MELVIVKEVDNGHIFQLLTNHKSRRHWCTKRCLFALYSLVAL